MSSTINASADPLTNTPLTTQRLAGRYGARDLGVDCTDVSDATWQEIVDVFHDRHVVVLPDQKLTPNQHADFMQRFAVLDTRPQELSARSTLPLPRNPKVELITFRH